jgi:hypothetical protein
MCVFETESHYAAQAGLLGLPRAGIIGMYHHAYLRGKYFLILTLIFGICGHLYLTPEYLVCEVCELSFILNRIDFDLIAVLVVHAGLVSVYRVVN